MPCRQTPWPCAVRGRLLTLSGRRNATAPAGSGDGVLLYELKLISWMWLDGNTCLLSMRSRIRVIFWLTRIKKSRTRQFYVEFESMLLTLFARPIFITRDCSFSTYFLIPKAHRPQVEEVVKFFLRAHCDAAKRSNGCFTLPFPLRVLYHLPRLILPLLSVVAKRHYMYF